MEADGELSTTANTIIGIGRRTTLEVVFLERLFTSIRDAPAAVGLLNSHIAMMDRCKLVQDDIEANVWNYVSLVLNGH